MNNNKQSMKLYTEEQLKEAFNCGRLYLGREGDTNFYHLTDKLTPIEIPSDEEVEKEARLYCNIKESLVIDEEERYYKDFQKYDGFKACAKWMRDKIQGGNNE